MDKGDIKPNMPIEANDVSTLFKTAPTTGTDIAFPVMLRTSSTRSLAKRQVCSSDRLLVEHINRRYCSTLFLYFVSIELLCTGIVRREQVNPSSYDWLPVLHAS